ncbi:MAG TPA: phosphoribosylanthranilate isomerase [Noviherbaspirillum sp.]|uniref:phosphoribosylanthranilate isomerase n=1 Tax=Noviherbaspirillum sp. TaxID=1926288 RepID=UPI002F9250ED
MTSRTRIKICGLRAPEDVRTAVEAGADAIGLVFYPGSPRHIDAAAAASLVAGLPPYVTVTGLFVNASRADVDAVVRQVPVGLLQFHGDESVADCQAIAAAVNLPFMRALRVGRDMGPVDLLEYERTYRAAGRHFSGLLLDAFVDGYGGGGKVFDWSLIPKELAPRVVLSGGLNARNAIEAVHRVRPYGVDVSSGVERAKGIKDPLLIREFIEAVRHADASQSE